MIHLETVFQSKSIAFLFFWFVWLFVCFLFSLGNMTSIYDSIPREVEAYPFGTYLNVASHCLAIISFQHQLHSTQRVHRLGESTVFLVLDIGLEVQMPSKAERVEILV